ncbi:unnamed protein product [Ceratitis capitata]|uniref:(Mediterranean fruit fly) hypothetical protein n=1 Tax=Ceratitis capitata TaxID=7213 RepID=A0A811VFQ5_CERCA|nr:unnamed protein product [Ceratitis capitata]
MYVCMYVWMYICTCSFIPYNSVYRYVTWLVARKTSHRDKHVPPQLWPTGRMSARAFHSIPFRGHSTRCTSLLLSLLLLKFITGELITFRLIFSITMLPCVVVVGGNCLPV